MERNLLITVSEDQSALFGVRFVASFFTDKNPIKITLLYIAPDENGNDAATGQALEAARQKCISLGFAECSVQIKSITRRVSLIRDILAEARRGVFDAIVLGRRGVSRLEEMLGESTSRGIIEEVAVTPVWVCRVPDPTRRNVLLCVDGSEQAFRAADHVGFVLGPEQDHDVTLLSVVEKGSDPAAMDQTLNHAARILRDNGVDASRISQKTVQSSSPQRIIAKMAAEEGFAVVAVGRTASGNGFITQLFSDSVSANLFHDSGGASLWIAK
ncbi:universal stress protein [Oceanidesulfovibrio marinus]|uniref:Universal stress protein n=1 Tax=Oceanidesulfovibrio marinus TaxID=370038 RepID=A0A6P1ZK66_9BACT|nr:universal stress protein [Oceanidesulfovibrio marinus]QJT09901.1 universal stress protein [Oceanidesulfovibrio marinus]TVM35983.1 hypothetical protein DQK91_04860 [Oceanidesulfovibrio marinus]